MIQNINELKDDSIKSPIHLDDLDSESDDDYDENSKYSKCLWLCKKKFGIQKIKDSSFLKSNDEILPLNI